MTDGRSWQGNWKARLHERVQERGFDSLAAFAESRPAIPLNPLAEELGRDDVAGGQVMSGLLDEAERRKQMSPHVYRVRMMELESTATTPRGSTNCFRRSTGDDLGGKELATNPSCQVGRL